MKFSAVSRVVASGFLLLWSASAVSAQSSASRIMKSAQSGNWYVRITTTDQRTLEGRVTRLELDSAELTRSSVAIADIATIDRRLRVGGGAIPGAALGATAIGLFGYALVSGLCESSDCGWRSIGALASGAAMGASLGSTIGAMLGPGRAEWRRLYPYADSLRDAEQRAIRQRADTLMSFAGPAFLLSTGMGTVQAIGSQSGNTALRFGMELGATTRSERPLEFTGEGYALLGLGGGGILGVDVGANLVGRRGDYLGATIGISNAADSRAYSAGLRVGHRPRTSIGIRPEARANVFWNGHGSALEFSVSLGLETR